MKPNSTEINGSPAASVANWNLRSGINLADVNVPEIASELNTYVDLVRRRAEMTPEEVLYQFYDDDGGVLGKFTCADLDRKARAIAAHLTSQGAAGERALLLYAPGLDYIAAFFGCLYAGVTAVPAYPPDLTWLERSLPRLAVIADDAQPKFALTTGIILSAAESMFEMAPSFRALEWVATDAVDDAEADGWREPALNGDSLAFLQYTSGSTRDPKGVMLSHENLMANAFSIHNAFEIRPESQGTIWLPPYHDMGLIGGIMQPLYSGFQVNLMSPVSFLRRPMFWLEMVSKTESSIAGGPNFAYDLCVRKSTPEQRAALDLSGWEIAFNGAEPIRTETLDRFADAFECAGFKQSTFFNCYGMAETTLYVSGGLYGGKPDGPVSSGDLSVIHDVCIVNPDTCEACAEGGEGEIWVNGPNVARGYWNQPDATQETFDAKIAGGDGTPYLRTGDLGILRGDELFVTGRRKDLIVIRGTNHYPQDIEQTVEHAHPALRRGCVAAFSIDVDGEERLAVVQEVNSTDGDSLDTEEIFGAIRREVSRDHDLHVHGVALIAPRAIAKTSSGKIQRQANKAAYLDGSLSIVAQSDDTAAEIEVPSDVDRSEKAVDFSLLYFASNDAERASDKYRLYIEGAKFADQNGFKALWTPERHFHAFGGLYPNPSVLSAALAMVTDRIRLRAGSVVLPLHDPVRVAEEWAVVDNLSNGRVDLAFAQGWNANDFVLSPDAYDDRKDRMYAGIETVRKLWQGESITLENGTGEDRDIKIYPLPQQPDFETWMTCSGGVERFIEAGAAGLNVLTALLFQEVDALAEKLASYRQARADNGHDPDAGHVTLMLHTYVDDDMESVRERVREPFKDYLESSVDLWRGESDRLENLGRREREDLLEFAFERYFQTTALMGTPDTCAEMVERLSEAGVDEIACLIDFGVDRDATLAGLRGINTLRQRFAAGGTRAEVSTDEAPKAKVETGPDIAAFVSPPAADAVTPEGLAEYLRGQIAEALETEPESLSDDKHVMELGLDSIMVIQLIGDLQRVYGIRLHPREVFEHPSIGELAGYLCGQLAPSEASGTVDIDSVVFYPKSKNTSGSIVVPTKKNDSAAFILSTPRAGSTLLRVMLGGHPELFCPPELHLLPFETMVDRDTALAGSFLGEGLERAYMELSGLDAKAARAMGDEQANAGWSSADAYRYLQEQTGGRMLVDKSPSYAADIGNVHRAEAWFDAPKYILLTRHPYAVIESMVRHRFHQMLGAGDSDPQAFAERVWTVLNQNLCAIAEEIGSERCRWVRYEDLVEDPDRVTKDLCSFLGVPHDPRIVSPYEGDRMTDGVHAESVPLGDPDFHTHSGVDSSLARRWEVNSPHYNLNAETIGLAAKLGYELKEEEAPRSISAAAEFEEGRL
jgi:natural product biosynthesis luciferase-like monooxygenase protein